MKSFMKNLSLMIMLVAFAPMAAAEQGAVKVTNTVKKQVISVTEDGKSTVSFVEPDTVIPGDVLMYTIEFENIGDQPVADIVIDDPVPNNSFYRDGSARGENTRIQFSIDGKRFDSAENLMVEREGQQVVASARDYSAIRWVYTRDLQPGEKKSVSFKTQLKNPGE